MMRMVALASGLGTMQMKMNDVNTQSMDETKNTVSDQR